MFRSVTVRGARGTIIWNTADAAVLGPWAVSRANYAREWALVATVQTTDSYRLRQVPLRFLAPRTQHPRGFTCFPVIPGSLRIDGRTLVATLAQPEGR